MKNVSLALAVSAMAACLFIGAAYGDGTTESFGGVDYTYAVTNDEATITSIGNSLPDDLVLPGTLGGKPVVAIRRGVFPSYGYGYPNLKSIVFPDSLREIAEDNLANCPSLTNVTFGTGMEVLGYNVFADKTRVAQFTVPDGNPNFSAEGGILYSKDKTTLVRYAESATTFDIPDTVTVVGEGAFYYHDLVGVTFPAGLKEIRDNAFACNFDLDIPALPGGLTVIGEAAFRSCMEIKSVVIPDGVAKISNEAFNYCEKLSSLTIGSGVGEICETAFGNCFALGKVVIPQSVTNIQGKAFLGCTNLTDVTIGSGVAIMGTLRAGAADEWGYVLESEPAFGACLSLMNFKLADGNATFEEIGGCLYFRNTPKTAKKLAAYPGGRGTLYFTGDVNVTELGEASCSRCDNFVDITIPATVREIGPQSMINCAGLSKLTIPAGPVNISAGAFMMNPYLYDVEIAGTVKTIGDMAFMHDFMPWDDADGRLVLHEGIETIGDAAFARSMNGVLREVVVPDSVTSLGIGAFANAFNLESVVLGSGVTALPESVFSGGSSLTNFIAKGTLTSVGAYAFESCYSLDCIALANAVEIGAHAFDNCYGLRNVDLYAPLETISSNAFDGCSSLNTVVVPPNVTAIGDEAFDGCTGLTKAYLPKALEDKIDTASIFSNCKRLGTDGIVFYGADEWDELAPEPPVPPEPLDPFTEAGLAAEYLLPSGVAPDLSGIFASVIGDGWKVAVSGLPTGLSYNATKATLTGAAKNEGTTLVTFTATKGTEKETATSTFAVAFPTLTIEVAAYGADASATNKVKVAGGGKYAAGSKVTLKATPATGSVFAGWYGADGEPLDGAADYRTASFPYVTTDADVTIVAKFATVAEDTASLTVNFGTEYTTEKDGTYELALGPLVESVTVPKLTVTGLPTGLKYDAKTLTISGKATKPGESLVKVQATNTSVKKATDATTGEFTIKVPNFTTPTFTAAGLDTDGKYVLNAGAAPDLSGVFAAIADGEWKLAVSGLPTGLKYDAAKGLTGVATKEGVYTVTFTATKGSGRTAEKEIATATFEVVFPTLTLAVAALDDETATNKVKVAGGGRYAEGSKVTLKATTAVGSVFAGWYDADGKPLEGAADYRTASFPYVATDADVTLVAKFATVAEDTASLKVGFGTEYTTEKDGTFELALGPLVESVTVPKLTVTGLPTGLKYDAKTLKIGGKATKPGESLVKVQATNTSVKKATDATTGEFTIKVPNFTTPTFAAAGLDTDGKYVLSAGAAPDLSGVFAELADGGWKLAVSGLPAGLKYDAAKGLTGVATKEGVYTVTFTATKGSGKMAEKEIATATFEVAFPTLTLEVAAYGADASATNKVKVAGGGKYAAGTKATLKATPATGSVFAGWYDTDGNPLEGSADYRTASFPYVTTDADVTIVAKFATVAEDMASLKVTLADDSTAKDGTYELALGPLVESVTVPKLTVTGLPAGLTYDAKTMKIGGKAKKPGKSVVKVQATNTSVKKATDATTGEFSLMVPNFESDKMPNLKYGADDYGVLHSGVAFNPELVDCMLADGWAVKVSGLPAGLKWDAANGVIAGVATAKADSYTVTFALSKGTAKETATITLNVEDLPAWAVGTFDGAAYAPGGDPVEGIVQALTVDAKGKIGGKILKNGESWALSAASFDDYDADSGEYYATVIAKNGARVETNSIAVSEAGVEGLTLSLPASSWSAWQNLWKRADTKASQPVFKSNIVVDHYLGAAEDADNLVKLTFQKDGVVKFAGKVGGASVSGTSQLVNDGKGWTVTLYAPPKAPFKGWCETFAVTLETENNVVTDVTVAAASAEPPPAWGVGEYIGYGYVEYPPATLDGLPEYLWGLFYVDMNDDFSFTGRFVPVSGPGSPAQFSGNMYRVQVSEDIFGYHADDVAITVNGDDALLHFQFITMGFGKMSVITQQCSPNLTGVNFFDVVHNIWARDDFPEARPTFAADTTKVIELKDRPGIYSQAGKPYVDGETLTFSFGEGGEISVTGSIFGVHVNTTATIGVNMIIEDGAKLDCHATFAANGRIYQLMFEIPSSGTVTAADIVFPDGYFSLINGW